jgi:hypothetical protein
MPKWCYRERRTLARRLGNEHGLLARKSKRLGFSEYTSTQLQKSERQHRRMAHSNSYRQPVTVPSPLCSLSRIRQMR